MAYSHNGAMMNTIAANVASTLYTAPASTRVNVTSCIAANVLDSDVQPQVTLQVVRAGQTYELLHAASVPRSNSLEMIVERPVVLLPSDQLQVKCNTLNGAHFIASLLELPQ